MSSGNGSKKVKVPYKFNTVQLNSLKAHPKQVEVREITNEALQGLGNFIDKVGLVEEIAINERTGHIISGHQRCKVLIDKGYTSAKVKVFDVNQDIEDLMFTNLNSQAISGGFTDEAKPWVQSLEARLGSELYQDVGLQMLEVSLADPEEVAKDGLTDPDDVPATPKEAKTKTGDLYQLGDHRLLCGDATKKEDVERLMGGEKADMVFTDPPYGVGYSSRSPDKKDETLLNDDLDTEQLHIFLAKAFAVFPAGDGCNIYICHDDGRPRVRIAFEQAYLDNGYVLGTTLIWCKNAASMSWQDFRRQHEPILFGWKRGKKRIRVTDRSETTVWQISRESQNKYLHITQKPVELPNRAMRNSSVAGAVIFDGFLGSGTTMIACEQLDRKCYGIEIEPLYVDVCVQRWESFSGKQAVLLSGKE